jgi:hypothetical protein
MRALGCAAEKLPISLRGRGVRALVLVNQVTSKTLEEVSYIAVATQCVVTRLATELIHVEGRVRGSELSTPVNTGIHISFGGCFNDREDVLWSSVRRFVSCGRELLQGLSGCWKEA